MREPKRERGSAVPGTARSAQNESSPNLLQVRAVLDPLRDHLAELPERRSNAGEWEKQVSLLLEAPSV